MSSKSRLDQLKQEVMSLDTKKHLNQQRLDEINHEKNELSYQAESNEIAMMETIRNAMGQSELAAARDRELLNDKLEAFGYKQDRTTEAIIQMKDEVADLKEFFSESPMLQEAYELKNRQLEDDYRIKEQQLEDKYERKKKELENNYELFKTDFEDEHRKLETECERIKAEIETLKKEQVELGDIQKENIKWKKIKSIVPKIAILIVFLLIVVLLVNFCGNNDKTENKALQKENQKLEAKLEEQNEKIDRLMTEAEGSEVPVETQNEKQYYVCVNPCVGDKESFDSGKMMPFSEGKEVWIVNKTDTYYQLAIELRDDLFLEKDLFEQNFVPKDEYE